MSVEKPKFWDRDVRVTEGDLKAWAISMKAIFGIVIGVAWKAQDENSLSKVVEPVPTITRPLNPEDTP